MWKSKSARVALMTGFLDVVRKYGLKSFWVLPPPKMRERERKKNSTPLCHTEVCASSPVPLPRTLANTSQPFDDLSSNLVLRSADERVGVKKCELLHSRLTSGTAESGAQMPTGLRSQSRRRVANKAKPNDVQLRLCDDGNYFSPNVSISSHILKKTG